MNKSYLAFLQPAVSSLLSHCNHRHLQVGLLSDHCCSKFCKLTKIISYLQKQWFLYTLPRKNSFILMSFILFGCFCPIPSNHSHCCLLIHRLLALIFSSLVLYSIVYFIIYIITCIIIHGMFHTTATLSNVHSTKQAQGYGLPKRKKYIYM